MDCLKTKIVSEKNLKIRKKKKKLSSTHQNFADPLGAFDFPMLTDL